METAYHTHSQAEHESTTSGILEEVFHLQRCPRRNATHFVLCKGAKLRFVIQLSAGIVPLQRAVASYGGKMQLLLRLLRCLPYRVCQVAKLGYFARVALHPSVAALVPQGNEWNALIGTYSDRQKVVFQCFNPTGSGPCVYIKVGNARSEEQMQTEIRFLQQPHHYRSMALPKLLNSAFRGGDCPFNMMVTEEFSGEKVPPMLTPEIYELYRELSSETKIVNQQVLVRSHGDFAPWNIRKQGERYILFDWEFCAWRPRGYDVVHYLTIVGMNLEHKTFSDAYDAALACVQTFEPDIRMDKQAFYQEYTKLMQF